MVVLAAGQGHRFAVEGHKLDESIGEATALARTLAVALASRLRLMVVCSEEVAPMVRGSVAARDMVVLPPAQAQRGMGHSIAAGVTAAADASGWLILPGDMPWVRPDTLRRAAAQLAHDPIVVAQYRGQRGHPVGFSTEMFTELIHLSGDDGARRLLARYAAQPVVVDDPGVLIEGVTADDAAQAQGTESAPGELR